MNKKYKLLSFLLSTGIVASAFPSSGTGATSESIAFYNSKKSILEMKEYDEVYDTNHDGVVNVFDVIRENKEVFQEESYTDLKSKIYSLETQIEILTQKLTEKEDKTQAESDLSEINSILSSKVDMQDGKQLSSNDYTDEEKYKLENLNNYDDASLKSDISDISSALSQKVDNQEGKQLSSNDYTDEDKEKLNNLNNYDDTSLRLEISESLSGKVDNQEGKRLSSNDYTDADKAKLEGLDNYDDTEIKLDISNINSDISIINEVVSGKVDQQEGKQLSSNNYTDEEKNKLEGLSNYDDTKLNEKIDTLTQIVYEEKKQVESSLQNIADKMDIESKKVVYVGVNGDYTSILSALKYTDNNTKIIVESGTYNIVKEYINEYGSLFWQNYKGYLGVEDDFYKGLWIDNGRIIEFSPLSKVIWDYDGLNSDVNIYFSPFSLGENATIVGLNIFFNQNCRYAIHDDFGSSDGTNIIKDCIFNASNRNGMTTIGGGCNGNNTYKIENCIFNGDSENDIAYHNSWSEGQNRIYVTNCYGKNKCYFGKYGQSTETNQTYCIVSGCKFGCIICVNHGDDAYDNMVIVEYNNVTNE